MNVEQAIVEFQEFVAKIGPNAKPFLCWLKQNVDDMTDAFSTDRNADVMLESIREDLRTSLPLEATTESETILPSTTGLNYLESTAQPRARGRMTVAGHMNVSKKIVAITSDCDPATTVHVDAFLYDEEAIDELCDQGRMSRNYCANCGSRKVKPLTFLTHSASVSQIKYIFQYLLPDLTGKTVLDVGCRTGALLYGAHLYSSARKIFGVEMDVSFCTLQNQIIQKYQLTDRIQVIEDNIQNQGALLQNCDVVILNNVFEFFLPKEDQQRIWYFLIQTLRKTGSLIITIPGIEETLSSLQLNVDLALWLKPVDTTSQLKQAHMHLFMSENSEDYDLDNIHLYQVL